MKLHDYGCNVEESQRPVTSVKRFFIAAAAYRIIALNRISQNSYNPIRTASFERFIATAAFDVATAVNQRAENHSLWSYRYCR